MNFSDEWRSLFPISSIFPAPNLLASSSYGPLLFAPSSPPLPLLSSPSISLHLPPPLPSSSVLSSLRAFFRSPTNDAFLPSSAIDSLFSDLFPSPSSYSSSIPSPYLVYLRCRRRPSSFILFFPSGENSDLIGYVSIAFNSKSSIPEITVNRDGDVFKQKDGYKHPYHRILHLAVSPANSLSWKAGSASPGTPVVEGYLIAATLYSVNWFRVETRVLECGLERPFLVPLAKQGFEKSVVHACWSPHYEEESAALLESGELCWFNLSTKRGGKVKVELGGGDDNGEWLGCEFGEQPWVVTVVSSKVVVSVDLRFSDGRQNKVLAKVEMPGLFDVSSTEEKNDQFLAFCKADYNNFHMSLVTERLLFLFDLRNPLVPVLTWDHGLDNPRCIAMFRLLDLRPSDEFKWASESGFAILVGSFGNNEFNLFCYGPKEKASSNDSSLYAWELPSCLSLAGQSFAVGDNLIKDIFLGEISTSFSDCQQRKDIVVGFFILPDNLSIMESSSGGFALIRVMSSGKLEMQRYDAIWDLSLEERLTPCSSRSLKNIWSQDQNKSSHPDHQNKTQENRRSNANQPPNSDSKQKIHKHYTAYKGSSLELRPLLIFCEGKEERISTRYDFLKLRYLFEYMNGNLSNAITTNNAQLDSKEAKQITLGDGIRKLVKDTQNSSTSSLSSVLSDASIPTSIFEIASRRMLNCLQSDLLSLAFSTYSDLFGNPDYSFEFLEVPSCLPHNQFRPFFVGKPSRRGEKWSSKASSDDGLVGPVLPIPVLVTLHEIDYESNNSSFLKEKLDGDLLSLQCKEVLENVFSETEISIADTDNCKEWSASQELHDEKPFFIYEPVQSGSRCKIAAKKVVQEEQSQANRLFETCSVIYKDEKFTTFIGGIVDKMSNVDNGPAQLGSHIFDMSPVRLDFDSSDIVLQPAEQKIFKCLKRQFVKWQENYKPYQDFCTSSKLPKSAH